MKIIDTNSHGDYNLVRDTNGRLSIRTSAGSILVYGQYLYVMKRWQTFKNT